MIKSPIKLGLIFDKEFNLSACDDWSKFVYTNILPTTFLNSFSLVDIYKKIIGTNPPLPTHKIKTTLKNSKNHSAPFSSSERKFWAINKWEEIILQVLKKHS